MDVFGVQKPPVRLSAAKRFSLWVQYDVPWGGIALAVVLIAMGLAVLASATGLIDNGSNRLPERDDPNCVRYSHFASSC
ncbi:MAG: hypothetical protein EOS07_35595 [Mesorhizobium sp.]|nr:MAG: hypothetical protein EOS07_35595 [Mesorhizobium sp.]